MMEHRRYQGVILDLTYDDANAALDWLTRVFGFEERARYVDKDGAVRQAEIHIGDTEVEVRFEAIASGTRVTLEHRGLDRLPDDVAARLARYGWQRLAGWFESYVDTRSEEECP